MLGHVLMVQRLDQVRQPHALMGRYLQYEEGGHKSRPETLHVFLFFCPNDSQKRLFQQGVWRAGFGPWVSYWERGRFRGCVGVYESLGGLG